MLPGADAGAAKYGEDLAFSSVGSWGITTQGNCQATEAIAT